MNKKRVLHGLIWGALLGVLCIVGASIRSTEDLSFGFLFAFWYNRLLMGLVIGLFPLWTFKKSLIRGAVIGLLVSFAFYSATDFQDLIGFLVGVLYGVIIEYSLFQSEQKVKKEG